MRADSQDAAAPTDPTTPTAQPHDRQDEDDQPSHQDASLIAGETEVPIGTMTGEFPAEQVSAARER